MSFSLTIKGANKAEAKALVVAARQQQVQVMPHAVVDFIDKAIDGLPRDGIIIVRGNGHMVNEGSYAVSGCELLIGLESDLKGYFEYKEKQAAADRAKIIGELPDQALFAELDERGVKQPVDIAQLLSQQPDTALFEEIHKRDGAKATLADQLLQSMDWNALAAEVARRGGTAHLSEPNRTAPCENATSVTQEELDEADGEFADTDGKGQPDQKAPPAKKGKGKE